MNGIISMGAYLSTPRTEKDSSDEKTDDMECGSSSMQGWRINQEVINRAVVVDSNCKLSRN